MADYKKIHISTILKHYKRPEIQEAIVRESTNKEIAMSFGGTGYGKRPDVLMYPRDILEMVKRGGTSFHCSEELWHNPLQITTGMNAKELNELRKGWDLILDIDCPELEFSKIAAHLLVQALQHHDIKTIGIKFSGNHGFHIGVPFESFPDSVNGVALKDQFPDGPRRVARYLQHMIAPHLAKALLAQHSLADIASRIGKQQHDIVKNGQFDPFLVLSIDTVLIASRHLYRMPYSLNEKSGLASIVIEPADILTFDKQRAKPENIAATPPFLVREHAVRGEATKLMIQAFDDSVEIMPVIESKPERQYQDITEAIPEPFFPPCIQLISKGIADGKKRAVFILINFLSSCGWNPEQIGNYLKTWNAKNPEPLRDVFIEGQLRYHKMMKKKALPPNCDNKAYMKDLGVCAPDGFCPKIKNPANYAIAKQRMIAAQAEKPKRKSKADFED